MNFEKLPPDARLWIFAGQRNLDADEQKKLSLQMDQFIASWQAHKQDLVTAWRLKYARFIFVGVDENAMQASGCSIDSLGHAIKEFENHIGCGFIGTHSLVFFRNKLGEIQSIDRAGFKNLVEAGEVSEETIVFDNTIQKWIDLSENRWELMMRDSWHQKAFATTIAV